MRKIYDHDWWYTNLRPIVDRVFLTSFRRYRCLGRHLIPKDGAVIFAPNHCNALCDALAVLSLTHGRKVFVSRADIFRNPRVARVLRWLKMMPIRRMRDGLDQVRANDDTFQQAIDTLRTRIPFCILPEGTHRAKHSLLPLSKGIFRIALEANRQFGDQFPVYIVPLGLEYGDYFHLWDSLVVQVGRPMNITEMIGPIRTAYERLHGEPMTEPQLMLALREELTQRMRGLILWVPDDENYEANWAELSQHKPAPFADMDKPRLSSWLRWTLLVLCFPLFVLCALVTLPMGLLILLARSLAEDEAFRNSMQFGVQLLCRMLTFGLVYPFWVVVEEYCYQCRCLRQK